MEAEVDAGGCFPPHSLRHSFSDLVSMTRLTDQLALGIHILGPGLQNTLPQITMPAQCL